MAISNPSQDKDSNDSKQLDLESAVSRKNMQDVIDLQCDKLLRAVAAAKLDTLQERVAWILNHEPETRDSDRRLQLKYWERFDGHQGAIYPSDYLDLTPLTSISRARAKLQNEYNLFQASSEVRQRRGKLSQDERGKAIEQKQDYPMFAVYADESGKTGKYLIVGSVWFLHGPETLTLFREIEQWRNDTGFDKELHFKEIAANNLRFYVQFVDLVLASACTISFKVMSVERQGVGHVDRALADLFYFLLLRGVEHENSSGRGPLPRTLQLWKDAEEVGRDKLFLANLRERLLESSKHSFEGRLHVDRLEAVPSETQPFIQIADLFTSSNNRILNGSGTGGQPKDQFAHHLLGKLEMPQGPQESVTLSNDMTVHLTL